MRLPSMIFFAMLIPIAFFWYGWTAEKHAHWIVPMLAQIPFGLGLIGIAFPIQIYLIDAFSLHAARYEENFSFLLFDLGAELLGNSILSKTVFQRKTRFMLSDIFIGS